MSPIPHPPHAALQLLIIPPLCMLAVEGTSLLRVAPRMSLPLNAVFCFASFVFGLPLAISLFPQEGAIDVTQLEPHLQQLTSANGEKITHLYYNKGL